MVLGEIVNVGCELGTIVMIRKKGRMSETTFSLSRVIEKKKNQAKLSHNKTFFFSLLPHRKVGVGVSHGGDWLLPKILVRRLCTDGIGNDFRDK